MIGCSAESAAAFFNVMRRSPISHERTGVPLEDMDRRQKCKTRGGIHLFENEAAAKAYWEMHTKRLKGFGIPKVNAKIFDVNKELSRITRGPIPPGM
jgi:hypothetical protein